MQGSCPVSLCDSLSGLLCMQLSLPLIPQCLSLSIAPSPPLREVIVADPESPDLHLAVLGFGSVQVRKQQSRIARPTTGELERLVAVVARLRRC